MDDDGDEVNETDMRTGEQADGSPPSVSRGRGVGRDGILQTAHIEERYLDMYSENMRNIHEK